MRSTLIRLTLALASAGLPACSDSAAPLPLDGVWRPFATGVPEMPTGTASLENDHVFSKWFGLPDEGAEAPDVLSDSRSALVVSTPSRFIVPVGALERPRKMSCGARRIASPGNPVDEAVIVELFLRRDDELVSLARAELHAPGGGWFEWEVEIPAGAAGQLEGITRVSGPAGNAIAGPPIAWQSPIIDGETDADRPDLLLVTIDTLRADALAHAPGLTGLIADGHVFESALSPSNWTLPSYASLFTGRMPSEHGAGRGPFSAEATNRSESRGFQPVGADLRTLADEFRDAGYVTGMIHQNPFLEPWTGLDRGFDRYVRTRDDVQAGLRAATAWWQANEGRPRFLVLHFMAPHLPYAPKPYRAAPWIPPDPLESVEWRRFLGEDHSPEERREFFALPDVERGAVKARYAAEVQTLDRDLAPWLKSLFATTPNLILGLHSDHGEEHWDDGSFEHGHSFHRSVVHVPLAVVAPGRVEPGQTTAPVAAHHLSSTLLELAAIQRAGHWPPSLLSSASAPRSERPLYRSEHGAVSWPAEGEPRLEPFEPQSSSGHGDAVDLDPAIERALAELGYLQVQEGE